MKRPHKVLSRREIVGGSSVFGFGKKSHKQRPQIKKEQNVLRGQQSVKFDHIIHLS